LSYEIAKESMEKIEALLGDYTPKTQVLHSPTSNYEIRQQEIQGEVLKEIPKTDLNLETLKKLEGFLEDVENILEQGQRIDYF
jgi:hypothetical protein